MIFMRTGSVECLVADEEEAKEIELGSTGWTCWQRGLEGEPAPLFAGVGKAQVGKVCVCAM